jgi:hypothetical protein
LSGTFLGQQIRQLGIEGAMITPEQCEIFAEACEKISERSSDEARRTLHEIALAWRKMGEEIKLKTYSPRCAAAVRHNTKEMD